MDERASFLTTPAHAAVLGKFLAWMVLAGLGGAVKFVSASLKSQTVMSPRRFLFLLGANVLISGFSGLMGALVFGMLSTDPTLQMVAAGIFGYMGTQGLDIIALTMNKRMTNEPTPVSQVIPVPASVDPAAQIEPAPARV